MKKLMIMALAVALVTVSEAASVNWSVMNKGWTMQDESWAPQGTSLWLIDTSSQGDIVKALKNKSVIDFTGDWESAISGLDGVYGTYGTSNATGMLLESAVTSSDFVAGETYSLATLVIDDLSDENTIYYNITAVFDWGDSDVTAQDDAGDADCASFSTEWDDGTGWQIAQQVPEPTSGLLMLIGMAGLALRRRRA